MKEQRRAEIKRELNRPTLDRAFDLVDPLEWEAGMGGVFGAEVATAARGQGLP